MPEHYAEDGWTEDRVIRYVESLLTECEEDSDSGSNTRDQFMSYYDGKMSDLPSDEGRSSVVSKDLRAAAKKLMPSLMRTLFGGQKYVKYEPVGPGDEHGATQASDYINNVVIPQCDGENAIFDAVFDAMILRTGILTWRAEEDLTTEVVDYTGYDPATVEEFTQDPSVQVLEMEQGQDGTIDFSVRRKVKRIKSTLRAVQRSSFIMHPSSTEIKSNVCVGERRFLTRSDLVAMGYDKEIVSSLSTMARSYDDESYLYELEDDGDERDFYRGGEGSNNKAMEEILTYFLYVRIDMDGDGIAELYHCVVAPGDRTHQGHEVSGDYVILEMEETSETPYSKVVIERRAHAFDGQSISDDMIPVQQVKTVLLRETLDNLYWQNTPQPAVDQSKVLNPDSVMNPIFGRPIFLRAGQKVSDALQWTNVPFVGDKSIQMLDYFDRIAKERTGITDGTGNVDPKTFEHMSARGAGLVGDAGAATADSIIKTLSKGGLQDAFRGLLRLTIQHADRVYTAQVRGEWVNYDPRVWNSEMDCTINVGMGAGSKDSDLQVLFGIKTMQDEIIERLGPNNPFVTIDHAYNLRERIVETAGFPSAAPYFRKPTKEEADQMQQQWQEQQESDNKEGEIQAKMQTEQLKAEMQMQIAQMKAQAQMQVEVAQMQADLRVREKELEIDAQKEILKAQNTAQIEEIKARHEAAREAARNETQLQIAELKTRVELEMHADDIALKSAEIAADREAKNADRESAERTAAADRGAAERDSIRSSASSSSESD